MATGTPDETARHTADRPAEPNPPMRADARRNRERVLAAAQEAFGSSGLQVGLDEIARQAGVGAGTVYRHFPTKESLFEAIVLHRARRLVDQARALADAGDAGRAFFGFITQMNRDSLAKRDLVDAIAGSGTEITANLTEVNRELWDAVEVLMRRAQTDGAVRDDIGITHVRILLRAVFIASGGIGVGPETAAELMAVICDGLRAA